MAEGPLNREAIDKAIEVLNRIHQQDPTVLQALIDHRVPCNEAVADDPTVQVGVIPGGFEVGMLGIINGIFGVDTTHADWGWIVAFVGDDKKTITHFGWLDELLLKQKEASDE